MLVLDQVSVSLGGRVVLHDVSLSLGIGEVLGVIGPNGAGKSTLLRAATGLVPKAAGAVTLDDRAVERWERRALGRRIAYLPQDRAVAWPLSVRAVVALGRLPHRRFAAAESQADRAAIARAMEAADVAHLAARPITELSGGERARALLARTLAQDAGILIADEPAAGLDPAHQLDFYCRFRDMAADGRSVIVALHDLGAAARFCDRLLLLHDGRQVALAAAREVLTPARLAAVYGIAAHIGEIDGVPIVQPLQRLS